MIFVMELFSLKFLYLSNVVINISFINLFISTPWKSKYTLILLLFFLVSFGFLFLLSSFLSSIFSFSFFIPISFSSFFNVSLPFSFSISSPFSFSFGFSFPLTNNLKTAECLYNNLF